MFQLQNVAITVKGFQWDVDPFYLGKYTLLIVLVYSIEKENNFKTTSQICMYKHVHLLREHNGEP